MCKRDCCCACCLCSRRTVYVYMYSCACVSIKGAACDATKKLIVMFGCALKLINNYATKHTPANNSNNELYIDKCGCIYVYPKHRRYQIIYKTLILYMYICMCARFF